MKPFLMFVVVLATCLTASRAATVNWSAGIDNGFSLESGAELPTGSLIRLGYFRDSGTGVQLTDSQIQALASSTAVLNNSFVEAASTTIGSGFNPLVAGHFAASSTMDTSSGALNIAGKQMYVWVLNAATLGAATQQAIFYWDVANTATNPDTTPLTPGQRWTFPGQDPVPGSTTIDLTDLSTGTGSLATGAKVVIGTYPNGTSTSTSASNLGLVTLGTAAPLQITTATQLANGLIGDAYSQTLAATGGTAPYTWTITSGTLHPGLDLSPGGAITGTPTGSAIINITIKVTDQVNATVSKVFTLDIAASPFTIATPALLPEGTAGLPYNQALNANGGSGQRTWALIAGSLPAGLNLVNTPASSALTGSTNAAGTFNFTLRATDVSGRQTSQGFTLTVNASPINITTANPMKNVFKSVAFSQTLTVSGGTGPYTWLVTSGALPSGLSLSSSGVLSGTSTTLGGSNYTVQVTDTNSLSTTKAFSQTVLEKLIAPVMDLPVFPTTIVSDSTYTVTLTANNSPKTFSAVGLPAGLKIAPTTGVISGRPTTSGVYNVQVKATNTAGTSPTLTAKLVVQALPNNAIGTWVGMIERQGIVNGGVGGRLDLTTTVTGAFTLKLTQGAKVTSAVGFVTAAVGASPQINAIKDGFTIALVLAPGTNSLTGNVTLSSNNAPVTGWRKVWNATTNPAINSAGYYTIGMDLTTSIGSGTVPQGTGYASFTVGLDGGLSVSGKTSDGMVVTTAGFMGSQGQILVHQVLYANKGSLLGTVTLAEDVSGLFEANAISGAVSWFKPATVTRTYKDAFGPLNLNVFGKYMAWAAKGSVVLGLPDTSVTAALNFDQGGLSLSQTNPDVPAFTYTGAATVVMPTLPVANPGKATLVITPATGAVSGAFTLVETTPKALTRRVTFQGMIIRPASGPEKAFGYFLAPQIPVGAETIANSPILSGKVTISQ